MATAPIDLSTLITDGNVCDLKCSYSFTYAPTHLQITNKGDYLSMIVDKTTAPPVIYNNQNYNVQEVRLYQPSLHTYSGGTHADAELVILHNNTFSTKNLLVCIPIIKSSTTTADSAYFFDQIITEVRKTANREGQQTVYNNPTFSLGKIVPMTPYYSYTGTLPWSSSTDVYDYIVFKIENAATMSPQALTGLKAVTNANQIKTVVSPYDVFLNSKGPVPPYTDGDIYIECQPTGDDGEVLVPARLDTGGILDNQMLKLLFNFTLMKFFIGALVMVVIWYGATKIIRAVTQGGGVWLGGLAPPTPPWGETPHPPLRENLGERERG